MADGSVYVYGMTVLSTIHRLKGPFPSADGYQEIERTFVMPGGEAANCAIVLKNLGVPATLDGCLLGDLTAEPLRTYLNNRGVDCSLLRHQAGFPGWRDIVLCDGESRTVFGWFVDYLFGGRKLWSRPNEEAIKTAACVAIDPFFGAESEEGSPVMRAAPEGLRHHRQSMRNRHRPARESGGLLEGVHRPRISRR